ncbi:MAG TPA: condensation domain-containing protein, partial [Cytophagales bacterium]
MKEKIEKSNVQEIFELSMIQKGMLFHYLKEANEHLYNAQLSFRIEGSFDFGAFKAALYAVQAQHEVLRSVFRWEEISKPVQI